MSAPTGTRTSYQRVSAGGSAAANPSNGAGQILTAPEIAAMSPSQRSAYMASLDAGQQQAYQSARQVMNHNYMVRALRKIAVCPPAGGSGVTQNYTFGTQLVYNLPVATGAFAKELLITLNVSLTFAAGTGATYALNASGVFGLIDTINILYNGVQGRLRPLLIKYLKQIKGFQRPRPGIVIAGTSDATIQALLAVDPPSVAVGTNQFLMIFRVPLNALHELSPAGMLPIQGSSTQAQVQINCQTQAMSGDPLLSATAALAGTGNAVTVSSGTIKVEAVYTDGQNLQSLQPVTLDLISQPAVPTAQYIIDTTLSPLTTGSVVRQKIQALLEHFYVVCCLIDAQQSTKFATPANVLSMELDEDPVGQNKFWLYGTGSNQSTTDYYEYIRNTYGQDLDEGIFIMAGGPQVNQMNPSNGDGAATLNMLPGGWTAASHGWSVTATGAVAGVTARVETWLVSRNPQGLLLA